jgi:hypothetical protein
VTILRRRLWPFVNSLTLVNGAVNSTTFSKFYEVCAGILLSLCGSSTQRNFVTEEYIVLKLCTLEVRPRKQCS